MKKKYPVWKLYAVLQLAVLAGCTAHKENGTVSFVLIDSIQVDESKHTLLRKPYCLRKWNDSIVAVGVNETDIIGYNYFSGKEVFAFDSSNFSLNDIYRSLKRIKEKFIRPEDSLSVFDVHRTRTHPISFPLYQFTPPFWINDKKEIAVFVQLLMPYSFTDSIPNKEGVMVDKHNAIFLIDSSMRLKKIYNHSTLPYTLQSFHYSPWIYNGLLLDGDTLYMNMYTDVPKGIYKKQMITKCLYDRVDSVFVPLDTLAIPYNYKKAGNPASRNTGPYTMSVFSNNYIYFFSDHKGKHVSNGKDIFSLSDEKCWLDSFIDTSVTVNETILSCGWLNRNADIFIACTTRNKNGNKKETELCLYAYSMKEKIILAKQAVPAENSFPYFNGKEVIVIKQSGDNYYFLRYEVSREE